MIKNMYIPNTDITRHCGFFEAITYSTLCIYNIVAENSVDTTCPIKEKAHTLAEILGIRDTESQHIISLFNRVDKEHLRKAVRDTLKALLGQTSGDLEELLLDSVEKILLGKCREGLWETLLAVGYKALREGIDLFTMQAAFAAAVKTLRGAATKEEAQALAKKTLWSLIMMSEGYRILAQKTIYEGLGINKALFQRLLEKYADEALEALTRADFET